jgi:hypothetical protein
MAAIRLSSPRYITNPTPTPHGDELLRMVLLHPMLLRFNITSLSKGKTRGKHYLFPHQVKAVTLHFDGGGW